MRSVRDVFCLRPDDDDEDRQLWKTANSWEKCDENDCLVKIVQSKNATLSHYYGMFGMVGIGFVLKY